jgi:hypothetical protein
MVVAFFIIWGICALELIFLPVHPIVNAICLVFGAIIPGSFFASSMSDIDSVIGWIIVVVLTLCGYICNIFMSGEDLMEQKTEDGKTFMVFSGISLFAYAFSFVGTAWIAHGLFGLFS